MQENLERLRRARLAGDRARRRRARLRLRGRGRLAEPAVIVAEVERAVWRRRDLGGERVLVTAGPNREPLDPVRFLSNRSTGRMGYAVAAAAWRRGAEVVLISGPTALPTPHGVRCVRVGTAAEMHAAVAERVRRRRPCWSWRRRSRTTGRPTVARQKLKKDSGAAAPRPRAHRRHPGELRAAPAHRLWSALRPKPSTCSPTRAQAARQGARPDRRQRLDGAGCRVRRRHQRGDVDRRRWPRRRPAGEQGRGRRPHPRPRPGPAARRRQAPRTPRHAARAAGAASRGRAARLTGAAGADCLPGRRVAALGPERFDGG